MGEEILEEIDNLRQYLEASNWDMVASTAFDIAYMDSKNSDLETDVINTLAYFQAKYELPYHRRLAFVHCIKDIAVRSEDERVRLHAINVLLQFPKTGFKEDIDDYITNIKDSFSHHNLDHTVSSEQTQIPEFT